MSSRKFKSAAHTVTLKRTMPDFLAAVKRRMDELGWTNYRLAKELRGKRSDGGNVPMQTVYEFLRGETSIGSRDLGLIFDALGIELKMQKR